MLVIALLIATPLDPPPQPLAGQLYGAIWGDVVASAMIGNGDGLAAAWYSARSKDAAAKDLHIRDLKCRGSSKRYRCTFTLLRDESEVRQIGENAPARLKCRATFVPEAGKEGWVVEHFPPTEDHVHSQSKMTCRRAGAS